MASSLRAATCLRNKFTISQRQRAATLSLGGLPLGQLRALPAQKDARRMHRPLVWPTNRPTLLGAHEHMVASKTC